MGKGPPAAGEEPQTAGRLPASTKRTSGGQLESQEVFLELKYFSPAFLQNHKGQKLPAEDLRFSSNPMTPGGEVLSGKKKSPNTMEVKLTQDNMGSPGQVGTTDVLIGLRCFPICIVRHKSLLESGGFTVRTLGFFLWHRLTM